MPDKGIDLLEEACVSARSTGLKFIDANTVDQLLTQKIGVNVGSISSNESENLLRLADEMHKRVVGQDEAINAVSSAIKRSRSGLTSTKRPIASFMFFGPTGVGKTEVAKTLADVYYGDEKFMIRVDMSEYQEQENLNRLIGYTDEQGNFIGGFLTESVRAKPFSLVLLDEIEKANKKVLDLFLQVLDEGTLNDGMGRKVDFTNTIIIMTSNVGSSKIAELVLKGEKYHEVEKEVMTELRNFFRIEFLNRFDKLIMFKPLTKIEVEQVVEIMLRNIKKNLLLKGINVVWNDQTREELAVAGFSPMYGARELRRVLQEQVEDKLADLIIKGQLKSGQEAVFNGLVVNNIVNLKNMRKKLLVLALTILFSGTFLSLLTVHAQLNATDFSQTFTIPNPSKYSSLEDIINAVVSLIRPVFILTFAGMILYGAWIRLTSQGDAEKIKKSTQIIIAAVIGFAIAVFAPTIVDFVGKLLGVQSGLITTT